MRENTVAIRPPRALWVPFDLGRPFGAPANPEFQTDVLRAALALLARRDGPVILEDYPEDAPGQGSPEAMEGMVCPVSLPRPPRRTPTELIANVLLEIDELAPWHELFRQTHEHSDSGLSGLTTKDAAVFLDEILKSGRPNLDDASQWGAMLRFACEDLRNYYLAAVLARPGGAASPSQAADWFWGETSAGALILALHPICLASEDPGLRTVAERQLVPRAQRHRLE